MLGPDRRHLTLENGNLASWLMLVWTLCRAVAVSAGWMLDAGRVAVKCVSCWDSLPVSSGCLSAVEAGFRFAVLGTGCTARSMGSHLVMVGGTLSEQGVAKMLSAARRVCGGTRAASAFLGLPVVPTVPYMHTTGNVVKSLFFYVNALLPRRQRLRLRLFALKRSGKSGYDRFYLREFMCLCASIVAFPSLLGDDPDICLGQLMAIASLFCQAWTAALYVHVCRTSSDLTTSKNKALAALRVACTLLVIFYRLLKPLDPRTKDKGVYSLYLHGAAMHLEEQLKDDVVHQCKPFTDNDTEGGLRIFGDFLSRRSSNVPWAAVAEDWVTAMALDSHPSSTKSPASELGLSVQTIRVCQCITSMDEAAAGELEHLLASMRRDFQSVVSCVELLDGSTVYEFAQDPPESPLPDGNATTSSRRFFERTLRLRSARLDACWCGGLAGLPSSGLVESAGCRMSTPTSASSPPMRRSTSCPELRPNVRDEHVSGGMRDECDDALANRSVLSEMTGLPGGCDAPGQVHAGVTCPAAGSGASCGRGLASDGPPVDVDGHAGVRLYSNADEEELVSSGVLPSAAMIRAVGLPVECVALPVPAFVYSSGQLSAQLLYEPLILRHFLARCGRGGVLEVLKSAKMPVRDVREAVCEILSRLERGARDS